MDNIKKFEDFLDRMQGLLNNAKKQGHIIVRVEDLENTFPELKESEDEDNKRISKEISRFLKQNNGWNNEWLTWLRKQGEQKPAEWSEEDEKMCQETIDWFEKKCFPYAIEEENPAKDSIKWLKSIKDKYTWKPSDEQMHVLGELVENSTQRHFFHTLESLYNDLKKIKKV